MTPQDLRSETLFERHTWKVFAGLSLIVVLFGVGDVLSGGLTFQTGEDVLFHSLSGTSWSELNTTAPGPANLIDYQVRAGGVYLFMTGLLSLSIALTALRHGDRWAWYAMWVWPLGIVLIEGQLLSSVRTLETGIPVPVISGTIFIIVSVATLTLSYRRYLRKTSPGTPQGMTT
jgi:hypothetical protein